jgi:hypothetical protein
MTRIARISTLTLAFVGALGLAACGTTTTERALSGGALGAAGGAGAAAVTGGDATTGALLGGAAGAAAGALTECDEIDLNPEGQCR